MKVNNLIVAAVQMNCVPGDRDANLEKAYTFIFQAIQKGAKLIVLPELFNTGYRVEENDEKFAETIPGYTTDWMERICKENNIYLAGAILQRGSSSEVVYDTAVLVGPEGFVGSYQKIHLWDRENTRFSKGHNFPVFDTEIGKIGLQICYEVGFPEGSRIMALKGADIILYPSAFGKARYYAWDTATKARALENGCFVIASNRTGTEKDETVFGGKSRIVDPLGTVLVEASDGEQVILAQVDLNKIAVQRKTIPYLRDLNKQLFYKEMIGSI